VEEKNSFSVGLICNLPKLAFNPLCIKESLLIDLLLVEDVVLIQIAGGLAALYGVGAFISYAAKMPTALILTTLAQGLFLVTILFTYVNNLAANVVFILAILMTITNIVVLGYEVKRVPSSQQKILGFVDAVLR
jgi:hypothetical protein